jgi:hypothetical protein
MKKRNNGRNFILKAKSHILIQVIGLFVTGISLLGLLAACAPTASPAKTQTKAMAGLTNAPEPATPIATETSTAAATITASPSLTATPPLSPVEIQGLKDAFICLTNNLEYASNIKLTDFCPGYWSSSTTNINKVDGTLVRKSLEPYLTPLSNLHWNFTGLTDVKKDERSTNTNQIYTGLLSTTLTGDVTLKCPSGTPAPFQTSVNIPVNGEVRISVYNYPNQAHETLHIDSWTIQGKPLEDYCSTLH